MMGLMEKCGNSPPAAIKSFMEDILQQDTATAKKVSQKIPLPGRRVTPDTFSRKNRWMSACEGAERYKLNRAMLTKGFPRKRGKDGEKKRRSTPNPEVGVLNDIFEIPICSFLRSTV